MYIPENFSVTDNDEIFAFIEANAFGQLISNVGGRRFSTQNAGSNKLAEAMERDQLC